MITAMDHVLGLSDCGCPWCKAVTRAARLDFVRPRPDFGPEKVVETPTPVPVLLPTPTTVPLKAEYPFREAAVVLGIPLWELERLARKGAIHVFKRSGKRMISGQTIAARRIESSDRAEGLAVG